MAHNPSDAECIRFIQERVAICSSRHDCPRNKTLLPKRVIDLGHDENSLRLYESCNESEVYAILSYCWGECSGLLKTTSTTLESFKQEILWQQLPQTIQDAMIIIQRLGLRYVWVDSLCIVQDSYKDWETEAAKMGQYYRNAYITIAASSSASAQCGILKDRMTISEPKMVLFSGEDMMDYFIIAQARPARLWPSPVHDLGPLTERGWTFQEHALSTRMIHFLDSEVIWECRSEMISEDGHPIQDNTYSLIREISEIMKSPETAWRFCVRVYSSRALSILDDKLPAISGIASHFQQKTGYSYLAGLWKETLDVDLVWSSWGWEEADKPPQILEGPSWSWASIHGGVAFDMEDINDCTHVKTLLVIKGVQCKSKGTNAFGQVTEGILEVTGPLQEFQLEFRGGLDEFGVPKFYLIQNGNSSLTFFADTSLEQVDILNEYGVRIRTVQRTSAAPVPFRGKVWCLWCLIADIEASEMQRWFEMEPMRLHGIVLAKSPKSANLYTRIGSVCDKRRTVPDGTPVETISIG